MNRLNCRAVMANPDLSRDLLDILATDQDPSVRWALIHRPNVPMDVLDAIDYHVDPSTRTYPVDWLWAQRHDREQVARYARSRHRTRRRSHPTPTADG